jgi:hypothetical protein
MPTANQGHVFPIVHAHASKYVTDSIGSSLWIGFAQGAFGVNVD